MPTFSLVVDSSLDSSSETQVVYFYRWKSLVVLGSGTDIWALLKYLFIEYLIQDFTTHVNIMPIKGTRQNVERGGSFGGGAPLVSFNHVIDPHFVTFSSSLYTTIRNPNTDPNPNRNPTVITDPHIGHSRSANCHRSDAPCRSAPLHILSRANIKTCYIR